MDKLTEENKSLNNELIVESEYNEIDFIKKKRGKSTGKNTNQKNEIIIKSEEKNIKIEPEEKEENIKIEPEESDKINKSKEKEKTFLQSIYDFFEELMSIVFDALYQVQYLITKNRKTIFWAFVSVFALSNFNVLSLGQMMEDNGLTKNNKSGGGDIKLPILYGGDEGDNAIPASNPEPANTGTSDNNGKNSGDNDNKNSNSNDNKDKNNDNKNKDKDKDKDKSNKSSKNGGIVDLSGKSKETRKEKRASRKAAKQERQAKDKALKDKYMSGSMFERIKKYVMKGLTAISIVLVLYAVVLFPIIICAVFLYKVLKYCFTNLMKL